MGNARCSYTSDSHGQPLSLWERKHVSLQRCVEAELWKPALENIFSSELNILKNFLRTLQANRPLIFRNFYQNLLKIKENVIGSKSGFIEMALRAGAAAQ